MSCFDFKFYIVAGDTRVFALNYDTGKRGMPYTVSPGDASKELHLKAYLGNLENAGSLFLKTFAIIRSMDFFWEPTIFVKLVEVLH